MTTPVAAGLRNRKPRNDSKAAKPCTTRSGSARDPTSRKRAGAEILILLVGALWCFLELRHVPVLLNESSALMLLTLASLVTRVSAGLPNWWIQSARTCPDSGLLYGTLLIPMVQASRLLLRDPMNHPERFEYDDFWFWVSIGNGVLVLLQLWLGSKLVIQIPVIITIGSLVSSSWLVSNPQYIANGPSNVPWFYVLPTMSLEVIISMTVFLLMQIMVRRGLYRSFTIGEGLLVAQGVSLFCVDYVTYAISKSQWNGWKGWLVTDSNDDQRSHTSIALQGGLLGVLGSTAILSLVMRNYQLGTNEPLRNSMKTATHNSTNAATTPTVLNWHSMDGVTALKFYSTMVIVLGGIVSPFCGSLLGDNPILWVMNFTFSSLGHLKMVVYWLVLMGIGLPMIHRVTASGRLSLIVIRKLYHVLALAMFAPALLYQPQFLSLAFGVAAAVLLLVESLRVFLVPPFGIWLNFFMRSYTDSRDEGVVILTHLYLLCGCAISLWLSPPIGASNSLVPFAGMLILGAGDAAGAIVGSTLGRNYWIGGKKTLEGTIAAVVCTTFVAYLLSCTGTKNKFLESTSAWYKMLAATLLTCLFEAFTKQIDNLVLPVYFMTLLGLSNLRG